MYRTRKEDSSPSNIQLQCDDKLQEILLKGFKVGETIGEGDCFFDAVAQGLKQLKPEEEFTAQSLRRVCKELAVDNQQIKVIKDARNNADPTVIPPEGYVDNDALWNAYLTPTSLGTQDDDQDNYKKNPTSSHGGDYQKELCALFLKYAIDKNYEFGLATEMKAAEKFDDVVLWYTNENEKLHCFVQAKHLINKKKISYGDLITSNNFALQKYFDSFLKIEQRLKKKEDFKDGGKVKCLIICTNADFDTDTFKGKIDVKKIEDSNEIFKDVLKKTFNDSGSHYQLSISHDKKEEIFIGSYSPFKELTDKLVKHVFVDNKMNVDVSKDEFNIFRPYYIALSEYIKGKRKESSEPFETILNKSAQDYFDYLDSLKDNEEALKCELRMGDGKKAQKFVSDLTEERARYNNVIEDILKEKIKQFKFTQLPWKDDTFIKSFVQLIQGKELCCRRLHQTWNKIKKCFVGYVLVVTEEKKVKFSEKFLNDKELPNDLEEFKNKVKNELLDKQINLDKIELNIPDKYLNKILESLKEPVFWDFSKNVLSNEKKERVNMQIDDFLSKLVFAADQTDIKSIIKKGIVKSFQKENESNMLCDSFLQRVDDWSKKWTDKGNQTGPWLTKKNLLNKTVSFQGKHILLNELINDGEIKEIIDAETLLRIFCEERFQIGNDLAKSSNLDEFLFDEFPNEPIYIPRIFSREVKIKQEFRDNNSNFFTINDINTIKQDLFGLTSTQDIVLISSDITINSDNFKLLCDQYKNHNVHWLKKEKNGNFIWKQSHGSLTNLRTHVDKNNTEDKEPKKITDIDDKVIIITAEPGMGKSTVLARLLAEEREFSQNNKWIIRINLKDCKEQIEKLTEEILTQDIVQFLSGAITDGFSTILAKNLFLNSLNKKGNIIFLFDGFDEINNPNNQNKVIKLLKALYDKTKMKIDKILITTRQHMQSRLEDELSTFSYALKPFSIEDQKEFLRKFWEKSLKLNASDNNRFINFAEILFKEFPEKDGRMFTDIPLHIGMIAKVVQTDFKTFCYNDSKTTPKFSEKFDLPTLYKTFIEKKYEVYFRKCLGENAKEDKSKDIRDACIETFNKAHQNFALCILFPCEQVPSLVHNLLKPSSTSKDEWLLGLGIIFRSNDKLDFVHRTFAEYFAASRFIDALSEEKEPKVLNFFLENVLKKENQVISTFFESKLDKQIIDKLKQYKNKDTEKIIKDVKSQDTLLHFVAKCGYSKLTECLIYFGADIKAKDKYGNTALHLAAKNNHKEVVDVILCHDTSDNLFTAKDSNGTTILHTAAQYSNADIIKVLLNRVNELKNAIPGIPESILSSKDNYGRTLLHFAAFNRNEDITKALFNYVKELSIEPGTLVTLLTAKDKYDRTILHTAARYSNASIIQALLDCIKELNYDKPGILENLTTSKDNYGRTLLHTAAQYSSTDIIQAVLGYVKELNSVKCDILENLLIAKDNYANTVLHTAAQYNANIIQTILLHVKELKNVKPDTLMSLLTAKDIDGKTLLHTAAQYNNVDIIQVLLVQVEEFKNVIPGILESLLISKDKYQRTLLHNAAFDKKADIIDLFNYVKALNNVQCDILDNLLTAKDNKGNTLLHNAALDRNVDTIEALLYYIKELNNVNPGTLERLLTDVDNDDSTLLHKAASNKNADVIHVLLDYVKGYDNINQGILVRLLTAIDKNNNTLLHYAALNRNSDIIQVLLNYVKEQNNAKPGLLERLLTATDNDDNTLLHKAAFNKNADVIHALLDYVNKLDNINPNILENLLTSKNNYGRTLLHTASLYSISAIIQAVLDFIKELNNVKPGILESLLTAKDSNNRTLLHHAVINSNFNIAETIFGYVKELNNVKPGILESLLTATDNDGKTLLHNAAFNKNADVIKALFIYVKELNIVKPGILESQLSATDNDGKTLLHNAAFNRNADVIQAYVEELNNVEPGIIVSLLTAKDNNNKTLLHNVVLNSNTNITQVLLRYVKEKLIDDKSVILENLLSAKDKDGNTLLNIAAFNRNTDIIRVLLDYIKELNNVKPGILENLLTATDNNGNSLLHTVAFNGNADVIKALLRHIKGLNKPLLLERLLNSEDSKARTVLHTAAQYSNADVVQVLLDDVKEINNVQPGILERLLTAKDSEDKTLLQNASLNRNTDIVSALLHYVK